MTTDRDRFNANPLLFLKRWMTKRVVENPKNRLPSFGNDPIFDEPIIGVSDGDDPIFRDFKKENIVGNFHLTPREALQVHSIKQGKTVKEEQPRHISVISLIFPININSRVSARRASLGGSARWNAVQLAAKPFTEDIVLRGLVSLLEDFGYQAVAPCHTVPQVEIECSHGTVSEWSEKHIAYASGLGTFSLNGGFISPLGKAVNLGSIVTDLALPITHRPYNHHMAYCLHYQNVPCMHCVKRCPTGSISKQGYNAKKCFDYNSGVPLEVVRGSKQETCDIGPVINTQELHDKGVMCGLCETNVPCEGRIPRPATCD